jgi:predicted ATP-binding protein involved in virulence
MVEEKQSMPLMVETEALAKMAKCIAEVQGNATKCAETLGQIDIPDNKEVVERWSPVIQESILEVAAACNELKRVHDLLATVKDKKALPKWMNKDKKNNLFAKLLGLAQSLVQLNMKLTCAQAEMESIDRAHRIRTQAITHLPPEERLSATQAIALRIATRKAIANG